MIRRTWQTKNDIDFAYEGSGYTGKDTETNSIPSREKFMFFDETRRQKGSETSHTITIWMKVNTSRRGLFQHARHHFQEVIMNAFSILLFLLDTVAVTSPCYAFPISKRPKKGGASVWTFIGIGI